MTSAAPARFALTVMLGLWLSAVPSVSVAEFSVSITIAPPPLPVYEQPAIPEDGFLWTPGYWSYGADGYFWVPGTWVQAPEFGLLWTPGYWGWGGGGYVWNSGYWGSHIGFHGGVNYGYGYFGHGYEGGYWRENQFFYNRAVNNINIANIHNVYSKAVINNVTVNNVSYNGGRGGISTRPTSFERQVATENHRAPTEMQLQHHEAARSNRALLASVNHGRPAIAATAHPGDFAGRGIVRASRSGAPTHPNELPRPGAFPAPRTGRAETNQSYRNQQTELRSRQQNERQDLQQRQVQEHDRLAAERANQARAMQTERQHQQQTQQLQQRHVVEAQQLRQTQRPPAAVQPSLQPQRQQDRPSGGPPQERDGHTPR